jgi:hypothetical protein
MITGNYNKKTRPALWLKLRKGLHPRAASKKLVKKAPVKKRIQQCSPQMRKLLKDYQKVRVEYLLEHPHCEVCAVEQSTQVHHRKGRGKLLCERQWFLAVCQGCHQKIHKRPAWAYKKGHMVRRIG